MRADRCNAVIMQPSPDGYSMLRRSFRTLFLGQPRGQRGHVDALDGLRGLAVLIVIASHLSNGGWLPQPGLSGTGKSGVYLFFVLSAYLLASALLARPRAGWLQWRYWANYALRRVLRIWPLYLFVLLLSWALTTVGVSGWHYVISTQTLAAHLALREGQSVLWSIPVEFTFYLWLPLICAVLVLLRPLRGGRWWGCALLAALLALATWCWPPALAPTNGVALGPYLVVFLAGVAGAWFDQCWPRSAQPQRAWRVLGGLLLLALGLTIPALWAWWCNTPFQSELNHRWFLGFGALWVLLLLAVLRGGGWLTRSMASAPMRLLGVVSFSAYLWHMPVIQLAERAGLHAAGVLGLLLLLLAVLLVAMLSFLLFERPWRELRWPAKQVAASAPAPQRSASP